MDLKNKNKINNETLLVVVGSLLLIISFILFNYEKILEVKNNLYNSIQTEIYKENMKEVSVNVSVDYVDTDGDIEDDIKEDSYTPNYIAFLEIDKIGLRQGLLPVNDYYNNVSYHVQILNISNMPDVLNGNLILAAHSGSSSIAYFKNLYKLELNDIAKVYYNGKVYKYKINNIYYELKDGSIKIYRDFNKTTLTLITCTKNDKQHQTVYISELIGVETY